MSCEKCASSPTVITREGMANVALVGNPNVGKSTLFNRCTGAHQAVVNAPGTTVEMMRGSCPRDGYHLVDLPGTYSLIAQSPDEEVVVDTLAGTSNPLPGQSPVDLAVVLLDATAMTRSLYLLGQVAQTGCPVVGVVTMADVIRREGEEISAEQWSHALGIPVVVADVRTAAGVREVKELILTGLRDRPHIPTLAPRESAPGYDPNRIHDDAAAAELLAAHTAAATDVVDDPSAELFAWVEDIEAAADRADHTTAAISRSDKIDRILLHPFIGIPVFFALMWLLFQAAANWTGPLMDWCDGLFSSTDEGAGSFANGVTWLLEQVGLADTWFAGLMIGGVATGLGVVASFIPLMFVIFVAIALLEDSGYMARAAFLGDRLMRRIGLDGRVILPLIMGFGCNLPSLAATRTLPNAKQRLVTTLIIPYTSCAARLTIYLMIARIFFAEHAGTVVFVMYVLSLVMVVLGALVLKPFITKGASAAPLMLVLPPYQMPRLLVIAKTTAQRTWAFVKGAGKIIIVMTLVVWLMSAIPVVKGHSFAEDGLPVEDSVYGRTAQVLEPVFEPAGFGDWHMTGALMTGFVAKETVISSIVTFYNLDEEAAGDAEDGGDDLGSLPELVTATFEKTAGQHAPVAAFAFLVFVLTYTPCLATVAEQWRQIGGRWTLGAVVVQLFAAWALATLIYQVGRLFW